MEFSPMSMEMECPDVENRNAFPSIPKFLSDCDSDESSRDSGVAGCDRSPTCKQLIFSDQKKKKKKKRPALADSCHISNEEFDSLFSDNDEGVSKWFSTENTMDVDDSSICDWTSHMKRPKTSTNVDSKSMWNRSRITEDQDSFLSDALPPFTKFSSREQFKRRHTKKKGFTSFYDSNTKENIPPNSPFYSEFMRQNQDSPYNSSFGSPFMQDYIRNEGHAAQIPVNSSAKGFLSPSNPMGKIDEKYIHEIDSPVGTSASTSSQATTKSGDCPIYRALSHEDTQEEMTGDFTRTCSLPVIAGRHADLKSISPHTLAAILQDEYSEQIGSYSIIDCRYPYEFDGGHIQNALNICTKDGILAKFFSSHQHSHELSSSPATSSKSNILIFHCEFSSERAPKLMRFLRNHDRAANIYPKLKYPEIYVLDGGYKAFFANHLQHCEPQSYKPMLHKDHANDLRHFRLKCKSWTGDEKRQSMTLTRRKTLRM